MCVTFTDHEHERGMNRMSYQEGWIREIPREGWVAFRICWREKIGGEWRERNRTLPREINGKETVKKDAQQALNRTLAEVNARQGIAVEGLPGVTFQGLLDAHWSDYVERNKLRDSTLDGYKSIIELWLKPYFGDMLLSRITKETVTAFFKHLRAEKLSEQYQKNIYGLLNKLFELAVAFELVQFTPVNKMLHRPLVEHGEKQTLPVDKVKAFFAALPVAFRAAIAVLLLTGMRQGELLGLRWQDVDFDSKLLWKRNVVYRGRLVEGLKQTRHTGRTKKHVIGMSDMVVNILTTHKKYSAFTTPESYVFCREDGRPMDPDHLRRYVLYPAMETAGVPLVARESGLHMFRHTVVSVVARRLGIKSAQDQAGHADIGTTADTYTHVDTEQKLESAQALQDTFAAYLLPALPVSTAN
jgi:integrase